MRHRPPEAPSSFPHWVALGSLGVALVLFFGNTAPALREQQALHDVATDLQRLQRSYDDAIRQAALGLGPRANYDLQALLVAIDQQGYTPLELCAAYPRTVVASPTPEPDATAPESR